VARLLGLPPDDPEPARFVGLTVLDLVFNRAAGTNLMIGNPEVFQPLFLRMFKIQTQPHANESWFLELLERAWKWPGFVSLWSSLSDGVDEVLSTQPIHPIHPIHPIEFRIPGIAEPMRFRIALIYLTVDPRFQVVHWIPFGAATLGQFAEWAEEDGKS
jgi:hypothetical protein